VISNAAFIFISLIGKVSPISAETVQHPPSFCDVQKIIVNHCVRCHYTGGPTPFPLITYQEISNRSQFIEYVIEHRIMPPWPADTSYSRFRNENLLTSEELNTIKQWIQNGKPNDDDCGEMSVNSPVQADSVDAHSNKVTLCMEAAFKVEPSLTNDLFKRIKIPTGFDDTLNVKSFSFRPGNYNIVHHSEVFISPVADDHWGDGVRPGFQYEASDTSLREYLYTTGWLPGLLQERLPVGVAHQIPKDASMFFLMHYVPTYQPESDSSCLILEFHKDSDAPFRNQSAISVHGHQGLLNGPFELGPEEIRTFHAVRYLQDTVSIVSVLLHAHHLCQSMLVYAVTPNSDTINLIHIPKWDFNWQFQYRYNRFVVVPARSMIHFFATYDNTSQNPENPNNPPRRVTYSFENEDEMMELFLYYLEFEHGDEGAVILYE